MEKMLPYFIFFLLFPLISYVPLKSLLIQIPRYLLEPCIPFCSSSAFEPYHQGAAALPELLQEGPLTVEGRVFASLSCIWGIGGIAGQIELKPKAICSISLQVSFRYCCHGMQQLSKIFSITHRIFE